VTVAENGELQPTGLAAMAHRHGLLVHPYTLRADALPEGVPGVDALHRALLLDAGVDGLFSDFPDLTVDYIRRMPGVN